MADTLKVAMIGAGSMAPEHIKAFNAVDGVRVVGITNRTRAKAQALADAHGIEHVCDTVEELFAQTQADIAVMAVYEPAILQTAKSVFAQDWTVLMEKPIGLNLAEAEDVAALAKDRAKPVYVGLNRRTLGSSQAALRDLNDHGTSRYVHVQDQQSLETARAIGHAENVVQNWMFANSIHLVDYLLAFGRGEVTELTVLEPWDFDAPGRVVAHVRFESGDTGLYEAHWNAPGPWAVSVTTPERRWEMRPLESARFQNAGERSQNDVERPALDVDYKPGFALQAQNVCAAVRGQDHAAVPVREALRTTRLVAQIYGLA